jgi:tRNA threonylcarbamoyladenosine biosynthesis protein TsaE
MGVSRERDRTAQLVGSSHVRPPVLAEHGVDLQRLGEVARQLGKAARPGELVLLFGPLGAGKTTMVRLVCEELGVTDAVRSPSFTIANVYDGPVTVHHLDLYRLEESAAEDVLALDEYVAPDVITLVEWPEAGLEVLGEAAWTVHLEHESPITRSVTVDARDDDTRRRWEAVGALPSGSGR